MTATENIGVVLIGRNEGERLKRALSAAKGQASVMVYVDSGSTDGSQVAAKAAGAHLVELDLSQPFTAARARNAGVDRLLREAPETKYIQFIDGDCALQPNWIEKAAAFLNQNPKTAVACGRRREQFPSASVYNRMIDAEWDTPVGKTRSCGGDALMRREAFEQVRGFNASFIAGEEPELCVRIRKEGWEVWRLDEEMTLHDAALTRFSQWWKRNRRAGHAFAEGAALHGAPPERHNVKSTRSIILWGIVMPLTIAIGSLLSPWALLGFLLWPLQVVRLGLKTKDWTWAYFNTLGKFPEGLGVMEYILGRLSGKKTKIIEYK